MKKIALSRGLSAVVDDQEYATLSQYKWSVLSSGNRKVYAVSSINGKHILMHRFILGLSDRNSHADHIDGDGLNNQRENLRICTNAENLRNRGRNKKNASGFKGVYKWSNRDKWAAKIMLSRKSYHLGTFGSPEEAARAYDRAAREHHGSFAFQNFPTTQKEDCSI